MVDITHRIFVTWKPKAMNLHLSSQKCVFYIWDVDECTTSPPCLNGGTCNNTVGSYECMCPPQWNGTNCDEGMICCLHHVVVVSLSMIYCCQCLIWRRYNALSAALSTARTLSEFEELSIMDMTHYHYKLTDLAYLVRRSMHHVHGKWEYKILESTHRLFERWKWKCQSNKSRCLDGNVYIYIITLNIYFKIKKTILCSIEFTERLINIKSIKTTSMECVNTGVLEKIKNI